MKNIQPFIFICIYIIIITFTACSSSETGYIQPEIKLDDQTNDENQIINQTLESLKLKGLALIAETTIGGDTGYLLEDENGKGYLILQGSSYNMGYQINIAKIWMRQ